LFGQEIADTSACSYYAVYVKS